MTPLELSSPDVGMGEKSGRKGRGPGWRLGRGVWSPSGRPPEPPTPDMVLRAGDPEVSLAGRRDGGRVSTW